MKLEFITTTFENNIKVEAKQTHTFIDDSGEENQLVNIYPEVKYQTFEGFGGALTDAAGYVYSQMDNEQKKEIINTYFGHDNMNYNIVRIHIDSCDFSLGHYEAMSKPQDISMESFNLERTKKYIIPLLEDVKKIVGDGLEIMISPWSPPAFMKTNGERNHGGKLKAEYRQFWAEYICKYIKELQKLGYKISRLSLQNEPKVSQAWDSCIYNEEEEKQFLRDYMYPTLQKNKLSHVEIFIWDHNKERVYERACAIIDEETDHMISGIAFHWYSGDHFEALKLVQEKFPDKKLILSEACIEYTKFNKSDYLENAKKYAHDIIGNLNNGMTAFYDWNIVLDERGGPNHVGNYCDAPYLYDIKNKELVERNTLSYINHFSKYIRRGAIRIATTRYTDKVEVTAFENPDKTIVIVVLNQTKESIDVMFRLRDKGVRVKVLPESISTGVI